jgi:hypothetical protein
VEVRFEGASFTDAAFVPKDTERSDEVLMRNFISELQTLTLFLEASHDDELLCQYSKEVLYVFMFGQKCLCDQVLGHRSVLFAS